jgi:phage terminase large subunit-like protein
MYKFQEKMVRTVFDNRFVIAKMPRQYGKTTTVAAMILWYTLFNQDYTVGILANKKEQSIEILGRIQLMYENLPEWLQQGIVEWNKGSFELENGSKVFASATSSSAIRGRSVNFLYIDEMAFIPSNIQEEFFQSVYPTITSGTTTKGYYHKGHGHVNA